jgi:hypothetical protein
VVIGLSSALSGEAEEQLRSRNNVVDNREEGTTNSEEELGRPLMSINRGMFRGLRVTNYNNISTSHVYMAH